MCIFMFVIWAAQIIQSERFHVVQESNGPATPIAEAPLIRVASESYDVTHSPMNMNCVNSTSQCSIACRSNSGIFNLRIKILKVKVSFDETWESLGRKISGILGRSVFSVSTHYIIAFISPLLDVGLS